MSRLHVCNAFFESELEGTGERDLESWIRSHKIFLQLQFLPLLYAAPEDRILVTDLPSEGPLDPRLCLIRDLPCALPIEDWGPSLAVAAFAKKHRLPYKIPDWELVKKINSKIFSFNESPQLPGAKLLHSEEEIVEWIETTPGPKVLKTPFGTAGRGHIHFRELQNLNVKQQYTTPKTMRLRGPQDVNVKRLYICPLIGEPWVERVLDFSTQWRDKQLIGVTLFENTPGGSYRGTVKGCVDPSILDEHLNVARPLIEKIHKMGYSGHLGVDAFVYRWGGKEQLHPVVEINARKTMSWVFLQNDKNRLFYISSMKGMLPTRIKNTYFAKNIVEEL